MNNFILKHLSFLILIILGVAMLVPPGMAQFYGDVALDRAERQAIDYLSEQGIFKGQGGGNRFDPDGLLNRAEWAVLLTRERGASPEVEEYKFCFPDVTLEWFAAAICYAKDQAWVKGFDSGEEAGLYMPSNPLTVADILVMLSRMQAWSVTTGDTWYSGAYDYALQSKILSEALLPWHQVTRAQAAEILFRSLAVRKYKVAQYDPVIAELLTGTKTESNQDTDEDQSGKLPIVQVKAFEDIPVEARVVRGATNIPVFRFEISASEAVVLEELPIRRVSVGNIQDIKHARLLINGKMVKEGPFTGDDTHVFWRGLFPIEKNSTLLVEMNIDMVEDAEAALVYQFQVDPASLRFDKAVDVQGEIIRGEPFKTVETAAETVTISNSEKVLRLPYIGEQREIIARFKITAGNNDLLIKRIRLEDDEDITSAIFSNFRLTAGSTEIAFIENIEQNELDFIVNDYFLAANKSRDFTVRADISDFAQKNDQIRLYMDEITDLHAYDFDFNFGARVINEFSQQSARCVGSESPACPTEGLRKRCDKDEIEGEFRDCEVDTEPKIPVNEECDDRIATVCGVTTEATEETPAVRESFQNRCLAEKAGATGILPGPCQ